jgi:hypothetical protein
MRQRAADLAAIAYLEVADEPRGVGQQRVGGGDQGMGRDLRVGL